MEREEKKAKELNIRNLWHAQDIKEIFFRLQTSEKGLSNEEAELRLKKYGSNELRRIRKINKLKIFFRQFNSFLVYLIIFAALISLLLKHFLDFYVIFTILMINVLLGFFQEHKAERAIEKLREYVVPKTKVFRSGKLEIIDSGKVVPGDIIALSEGDRVMADARLIESYGLEVDESALTGESIASIKTTKKLQIDIVLADRENIVYFGTDIVKGNCKAIVVSTGMRTEFGQIAQIVQEIGHEKTPLQIKINNFAKNLSMIVIFICILVFLFGLFIHFDKLEMLMISISLAVAAIPEGLPAIIVLVLALTVQKMAKENTLVRKLYAAETLGSVTVLCVDKTGTLTKGEMQVDKIFVNNDFIDVKEIKSIDGEKGLKQLLKIAVLCNNARVEVEDKKGKEKFIGEPTEKALLINSYNLGVDKAKLTEEEEKIKEFSFTSSRKMMTVIREKQNQLIAYTKGSPEKILNRCNRELFKGKIIELSEKRKKELISKYEKLASSALRVLAFAYKPLVPYTKVEKISEDYAEHNLIFVGFIGMIDPPRPEVKFALRECKEAGIKVIMMTGDSALTARAIADEIGLKAELVEGRQLEKMSDAELKAQIEGITIFARISPKDKLRIVNILKEKGEIVGVTGDGVNDAPALKRADIGVAMGIKGTDVTKEVSDIILLDDNFATIVKAVKEGRHAYTNIKKFIRFLLASNFGEVLLILFSLLARLPLALLPLQILWINLVTDSFPALALGIEKAEKDVMKKKPKPKESIFEGLFFLILISSIIAALLSFFIFYFNIENLNKARTMAFTTLVFFELFFIFPLRSNNKLKDIGFFSNKKLIAAVLFSMVLQLVVIYTPLNIAFGLVSLAVYDWLYVILFSIPGLLIFEGIKYIKFNKQ